MSRGALRVAWYRFGVTFGRRAGGYVALVVFVGLIGGLAFGSLIAARRTEASYPSYLASTNPTDLLVQPTTSVSCSSRFVAAVAALPLVKRVGCALALEAETLRPNGSVGTVLLTQVELVASLDGLFSSLDKVTVTAGRPAVASRPDEVVASPSAAALFGLRVGSHLDVGIDRSTAPPLAKPYRKAQLTVVGIGVFNNEVVQDDIDRGHTGFLLGTPALAREFAPCCTSLTYEGLQLVGGASDDIAAEHEYAALVQRRFPLANQQLQVYETSVIESDAQRAVRPEAIALGIFGGIAAIAALVIGAQVISRRLRAQAQEAEVLWALGAGQWAIAADGLLGTVAATILGALVAAGIGTALSPFAVFGPVRAVESSPGIDLDWTVLGLGSAVLVVVLTGVAGATTYRLAPRGGTARGVTERSSSVVRAALAAGLPPAAVMGLRFALQPGVGRSAVPVRTAIIGGVLAVGVVAATITFGDSLNTLVSHPALYGWNFDGALFSTDGYGPIPTVAFDPLLREDHTVASATGVYFATFEADGEAVPAIAAPTAGPWSPPVLSGRRIASRSEVVLGSATLAALHKHIGDSVTISGYGLSLHLKVVGVATLPTIGTTLGLHASMSTGMLLSTAAVPKALIDADGPFSGPNAVFVRFAPGVAPSTGLRSLDQIAAALTSIARSPSIIAASKGASGGLVFEALPAQRPAEIANYRSMGTTPGVLAGGLAAGAVTAPGLTLIASVRRRRRELALLKMLGFTRRQLSVSVAWQASAIALLGLLLGLPLGIASGRWLWLLFARQLSVVAHPVVPALAIGIVAVATLLVANVVAALPGQSAARTPTALVLRSE